MKMLAGILIVFAVLVDNANCAETLLGAWKTQNGETAVIARCGDDYCITANSGAYAGQQLGTFWGASDAYTGRLTDPKTKATYSGKATVSGNSLKLRGCATAVLCKTQTWTRLD
jgi:uncharacterized protein (DUF2147 family)